MTTKSVEEICKLIETYQLMSTKDFAAMRSRWFRPNRKDVNNAEEFRKWLVLNRYLTDFVARVLSGRKSDQLVLNQYRLQDQLIDGPMAGAYLAHDALDRPVAIEVLASHCAADKAVLMAFQQAAMKAMTVQHPNVGRTLDVGEAHGLTYLVKEYFDGQTLYDVLQQRGKLGYLVATRLMALALAGLETLHAKGVPAGDLNADCLLLAPAGKGANQRTIKILHAGVQRRLFDETAIGRSISIARGIPDELQLANSCTFQVSGAASTNPAEDIFKLGGVFYQCLTGPAPSSGRNQHSSRPTRPLAEVAPDVPEMLSHIIEQMMDPDPTKRPQNAAHVAKSLRVFLAAEEHGKETRMEENIVAPTDRKHAVAQEEELDDEQMHDEEEDADDEEQPPPRRRAAMEQEGVWGKAVALWDELHPQVRDLLFLAGGALGMLALLFLASILTGIRLTYVAGLATGAAASYFVNRFIDWRKQKQSSIE
jgi:serine/threonine-protein kinase